MYDVGSNGLLIVAPWVRIQQRHFTDPAARPNLVVAQSGIHEIIATGNVGRGVYKVTRWASRVCCGMGGKVKSL